MRPIKQPPTLECIACIVLVLLLSVASIAYGVQRFSPKQPSYRMWEFIDNYVTERGHVRKCVIEAPSVLDALHCMEASGERFDKGATVRPCVTNRTRIVALERVP